MDVVGELKGLLECPLCAYTFDNPKQLVCSHQFCKTCLDERLQFNDNGEATIICPNRCEERTFIAANQTTNDLGRSFEVSRILDLLESQTQAAQVLPSPPCCTTSCHKAVVVYCCGGFLCRSCGTSHEKIQQEHRNKTSIVVDKREQRLKAFCQQHSTPCTHLCSDNSFLCIYCLNRSHKKHENDTIDEQAAKVKDALSNAFANVMHIEELRRATDGIQPQNTIELDRTLRERKLLCLTSYIQFLNDEEKSIRGQYQNLLHGHREKYPSIISTEYFNEHLRKCDIEIAMEKKSIQLSLYNISNDTIQPVNVSLSGSFGIGNNVHPLGELNISLGEKTLFCDISNPTFQYNSSPHDTSEIIFNLSEELKELEVDMVKYGVKINTSDATICTSRNMPCPTGKEKEERTYLKSESSPQPGKSDDFRNRSNAGSMAEDLVRRKEERLEKSIKLLAEQGFKYIANLIKEKENNNLQLLLNNGKKIAGMRDTDDVTPLHVAAEHNNFDSLKMLLQHGAAADNKNRYGSTALHYAAWHNSTECLVWLLQHYPQMTNTKDEYGWTALHRAAYKDNLPCVQALLQHGADVHFGSNERHTALDLANIHENERCIDALKKHCACPKCK